MGRERIELSTLARQRFAVSEPDGTEPDVLTKLDDRPNVGTAPDPPFMLTRDSAWGTRSAIAEGVVSII